MVCLLGIWRFIGLSVALGFAGRVASEAVPPGSVVMRILNHAGAPVELFWVNVFEVDRPLVKQTTKPVRNNTDTTINSYNTHEFILKFVNPVEGSDPQVKFTKGPKEEVITVSYSPEKGMSVTQVTKFDELLVKVKAQSSACSKMEGAAFDLCFAKGIADDVITMEDKRSEVVKYRDLMSNRLRNYTCADDTMNTTESIRTKIITVDGNDFELEILFDTPSAKIWVINDFISEEECQTLYNHGVTRLQRATVSGEDGRSLVSESRKAQQASYTIHDEQNGDPLMDLKYRVLSITNQHAGYKLQGGGQEDFTIIQYNKADEYVPHCDGSCDGSMYRPGGRVATAVMYCQVADRGGGTTFTKADVFVKPVPGMATFFSYKGADGKMEDGFTEHSGCPVLEGEKWITTAWMREGVSREFNSDLFDPSGQPILNEPVEDHISGEMEEANLSSEDEESEGEVQPIEYEDAPHVVDILNVEDPQSAGWMGGIVQGLNSWTSGFGKAKVQSDL